MYIHQTGALAMAYLAMWRKSLDLLRRGWRRTDPAREVKTRSLRGGHKGWGHQKEGGVGSLSGEDREEERETEKRGLGHQREEQR
jgi:hypothetical protein